MKTELTTDRDFIELLKQAAPVLARTGAQGLEIRFSQPPIKDPAPGLTVGGLAAKSKSGAAVVWVNPEQNNHKFLDSLFHELAHVARHMDTLPRCEDEYINAAPKSQPFPVLAYSQKFIYRETEANEQRAAWLAWVEKHGHKAISPAEARKYIDRPYHLILRVLRDYREPDIQKSTTQGGTRK